MKQSEPSVFFRVWRLLIRVQVTVGLIIFFYNFVHGYLGVAILLCFGWLVAPVGFVFKVLASQEFRKKGGVQEGRYFLATTALVDSGVYAVVRHPMYLGDILMVLGSILVSQHWLTLVLGVPLLAWFFGYVFPDADKDLIEKFGDEYKRYMQKVPRMNFVEGVIRLLQHRKTVAQKP